MDVARSMLRIGKHSGFASYTDEKFLKGVKNGSVIAGVSGHSDQLMIIRTLFSKWGTCSDLSFLLKTYYS